MRAAIFSFALDTQVELTFEQGKTAKATLWRKEDAQSHKPGCNYKKLVKIKAPKMSVFEEQMGFLTGYADIRQDRGAEIISQIAAPVPFYQTIAFIDPARTPYTLELLATGLRFANFCEQQFKYVLAVKRPIELSPQVQPMIATPTHGSLPSGHATEAFVMARLIWKLMLYSGTPQYGAGGHWGEMLMRLAARIATNRTVAGVHYPVDSATGAMLGLTLADFIYDLSTGNGWTSTKFDGHQYAGQSDFEWYKLYKAEDDTQKEQSKGPDGVWATATKRTSCNAPDPRLAWLWNKAQAEWVDFDPNASV